MKTSIVVTAEHTVPVYGTLEQALAKTGNKDGSGNGPKWAVWLTRGDMAELVQCGFTGLRDAEEFAQALAKDIAKLAGVDVDGKANKRVVRVG